MKNSWLRALPLPVFVASIPCVLVSRAAAEQPESTVASVEGVEPCHLQYGDHTTDAAISPATDIDTFVFEGLAGEKIRVLIHGTSNDLDAYVQFYGPSAEVIPGGTYCSSPYYTTCSLIAEATLPTNGTYTIVVSDAGSDNAGSYTMGLERLPRTIGEVVQCYATVIDQLQVGPDMDSFEFEGVAGALIQVNVQGLSNDLDPALELLDPSNALVTLPTSACASPYYTTCSFSFSVTLAMTGTYKLLISEWGVDNAGGYQFTVQFILPSCPTQSDFTRFCFGDGTGAECPCGPSQSGPVGGGCLNSAGNGGQLNGVGNPSTSSDTVALVPSGLPPQGTFVLFIQGTSPNNAGIGAHSGDGLGCVGGVILRLGLRHIIGNMTFGYGNTGDPAISNVGGVPAEGGTRFYQAWYRNANPTFCTPATFNLTNGLRVAWRP